MYGVLGSKNKTHMQFHILAMKHQLKSMSIIKETKLHLVRCISIDTVHVGEFSIFRAQHVQSSINFEENSSFKSYM